MVDHFSFRSRLELILVVILFTYLPLMKISLVSNAYGTESSLMPSIPITSDHGWYDTASQPTPSRSSAHRRPCPPAEREKTPPSPAHPMPGDTGCHITTARQLIANCGATAPLISIPPPDGLIDNYTVQQQTNAVPLCEPYRTLTSATNYKQ